MWLLEWSAMSEVAKARDWLGELGALVAADQLEAFQALVKETLEARPDLEDKVFAMTAEYMASPKREKPGDFFYPTTLPGDAPAAPAQPEPEPFKRRDLSGLGKPKVAPKAEPQAKPEPKSKARPRRGWAEVVVPKGASEIEALSYVPGLVGDSVDWIIQGAPRPNRVMAMGAALGTIGTVVGRCIEGPTGSATHLFLIILGMSGLGKDWVMKACAILLEAIDANNLLGPHEFASEPGTIRLLKRKPILVCFVDEYGDLLRLINSSEGNHYVAALNGLFKKLYNAWETIITAEKAGGGDEGESVVLKDVAMTLVCTATPESFFEGLTPRDLEGGFANRLLILPFEGHRRPPEQAVPPGAAVPPKGLVAAFKKLPRASTSGDHILDGVSPKRRRVEWGPGAGEAYFAFSRKMDEWDDRDPKKAEIGRRACENAARLATIVAVGCGSETVDREDIEWAIRLSELSFDAACGGVARYMHEYYDFPKFRDKVFDAISQSPLRNADGKVGWIAKTKLYQNFGRNMRWGHELKRALEQLIEEGRIRWEDGAKPAKGPTPKGYEVVMEGEGCEG
jgi:hypothetical protein